jgi:predicted nuclease of predicted toxin-antitoxin system
VYHQVYTPDYLREDTTVSLETTLYSATPPDEDLVWIGYSNNFNPKNAEKVIKDEVKLIEQELEKEAIIRKNQ